MGVRVSFGKVTEPEVLELIATLTEELRKHPVVGNVMSLTNMDYIQSTEEGMKVVPILNDLSPQSIAEFKKRLVDWQDVYYGTFISKDMHLAAIIVQPVAGSGDMEKQTIYETMSKLASQYKSPNISFPIAGLPVIKKELNTSIMSDIFWLIPVALGLIMLILFISFKRWEGIVFPLISLIIAALFVCGLIGFFHITFTMATVLVPVLLLVVGSAYGIHIISHFYEGISQKTGYLSPQEIRSIMKKSMGNVRIAVMLAGATTAGGFISLVSSPLGPFRVFGLLSAFGVVCSQASSLILLPILVNMRYRKGIDTGRFHKEKNFELRTKTPPAFAVMEKIVRKGRLPVLAVTAVLIITAIAFIPRINVGTDMIKFFPNSSDLVKDTNTFNDKLSGTNVVSVMIEAPEKGDILDPDFLHDLEEFGTYIKEKSSAAAQVQTLVPDIRRINMLMNQTTVPYEQEVFEDTFTDFFSDDGFFGDGAFAFGEGEGENSEPETVTENTEALETGFTREELAEKIHAAWLNSGADASLGDFIQNLFAEINYMGSAFNEIPLDPAKYGLETMDDLKDLISQYMVFYSGNLDMIINDSLEPDKTLISIQVKDISQKALNLLIDDVDSFWQYHLDEGWNYKVGGGATLAFILSTLVTRSQFYSIAGALLIVWLIVAIMFRSPVAGLLGLIPVVFAILGIFIFMVICNFNLDIITSLLASLAIGIGVDYAIHFMNAYRRHLQNNEANCLNAVYRTTGKAILVNAVSVAAGFAGLLISKFVPIRQMGVLFAVSMLFACAASLIILPITLMKLKPKFLGRNKAAAEVPAEKIA